MRINKNTNIFPIIFFLFIVTFFQSNAFSQAFIPFGFWGCNNYGLTDNTPAQFNLGSCVNCGVSGSSLALTVGQFAGTFTSRVLNKTRCKNPLVMFTKMSYLTDIPYGKELPTTSELTTNYSGISANLLTNLAGYWKLNESSGTTFADSSGNGNTGNKQGGVTQGVTGRLLNAITQDGSTGYVSTTNTFINPGNFTLSIWFRTLTTAGGKLIGFGNSQTGSSSSYDRHIYMNNTGQLYFGCYPGAIRIANSTASYNDGNWHHVAATLSSTAGMILYVDGVSVGTNAVTTSAQSYTGYIRIGYDNVNSWTSQPTSYFFNGSLDDAAFWTRTLSGTEIQQLYQRGANRIKFQIRSCTAFDCSDNPTWLGSDGSSSTFFTEINNNTLPTSGLGSVYATSPTMIFSNFPFLVLPNSQYFQYKINFESDSATLVPKLNSFTVFY